MATMRIAQVAGLIGVPATTLRYYEDIGLLPPPPRDGNGYRRYDDRDVERLRFVTRAKQLGITLEQVRELLPVWEGEECITVADRLARTVADRLETTREQADEIAALSGRLRMAQQRLAGAATHGPCASGCACVATEGATDVAPPAIACSLDGAELPQRMREWRAVAAQALSRVAVPGRVSLAFAHDVERTIQLARLAAQEHACCPFLDFELTVTGSGVTVEVRAPVDAHDVVLALLGDVGP